MEVDEYYGKLGKNNKKCPIAIRTFFTVGLVNPTYIFVGIFLNLFKLTYAISSFTSAANTLGSILIPGPIVVDK